MINLRKNLVELTVLAGVLLLIGTVATYTTNASLTKPASQQLVNE